LQDKPLPTRHSQRWPGFRHQTFSNAQKVRRQSGIVRGISEMYADWYQIQMAQAEK
jgi:hypothetical protein